MKHFYLKALLIHAFSVTGITASAYDVEIDGIYYNLNSSNQYAEVTFKDDSHNSYAGSVTIPENFTYQGVTYIVKYIGSYAFNWNINLNEISIPISVTSIGEFAFNGCTGLTSINLPEGLISIDEQAFGYCDLLTDINLPTSLESIGEFAFSNDIRLESITIPDKIKKIEERTFQGCTSLKNVIIGDNVEQIGYMSFSNCESLEALTIGKKLNSIGSDAFYGCDNISFLSINIPTISHDIITSILSGCPLQEVVIGENVSDIENNSFSRKSTLNRIVINSNALMSKLYSNYTIKNIFGDQANHYILGDKITTIGDYAFSGCKNLESVTISGSVKEIGNHAFSTCSALKKVIVPNIQEWYDISFKDAFSNPLRYAHHLYKDEENEITTLYIPDGIVTINDYAFYMCSSLKSVQIPNSLTKIGNDAFYNCNIDKVIVPDIAAWCGISFGSTFGGQLYSDENTEITDLIIPDGVKNINSHAFYGFTNLASVYIPSSVESIGESAFSSCEDLNKVIIPDLGAWCSISFDYSGSPLGCAHHIYSDKDTEIFDLVIPNGVVTINDYAFKEASFLTSITIPEGVSRIGKYAFQSCNRVTNLYLSEGVKELGLWAFSGCSELSVVTIPSSLNKIDYYGFDGCNKLSKVIIPDLTSWCKVSFSDKYSNPLTMSHRIFSDTETEIKELNIPDDVISISKYAFSNCSSLSSITLPQSVTNFGERAFSGCNGVTSIWSRITAPYDIPDNVFEYKDESGKTDGYLHATLYVPTGTKDRYETTNGWKNFKYIEEYDPTGILHLTADKKKYLNSIFDLNGQHLTTPQKGINIINGQKVIVK